MAESYDAYHKWLGIPPRDQPPHHYRLLGLSPFEDDEAVIENAAQARMRHVKTFASGPRANLSQKLLNELSAAQTCLLNPDKKAAYDAQLKTTIESEVKAAAPPKLEPLPEEPAIADLETLETLSPVVPKPTQYGRTGYRRRSKKSNAILMFVLLGTVAFGLLLGGVVVVALIYILSEPTEDTSAAANRPPRLNRPDTSGRSRTTPNRSGGRVLSSTDLLAAIDLDQHVVSGVVTRRSDGSIETNSDFCRIGLHHSTPLTYEIVAKVTRLSGADSVIFGLSYKGRRFTVVIDGFPEYGYRSGLNMVNGHTLVQDRNTTSVDGKLITNRRETEIRCQVHVNRIEVYVNNRLVTSYSESPGRLSMRPSMNLPGQPDLFLATWHTPFRVSQLEIREMDPFESMRNQRGR